jgi:Acyclic terpene utilisation family protein AtuA
VALRVANCSGFYGDRLSAPRELLEGGEIDVLTGDYLAELTMLLLWRARSKDPDGGYATTFLRQMEDVLGLALDRGVKVVANAGGLNPAGLAAALRSLAGRLGLRPRIAHVEGDDLLPRLAELKELLPDGAEPVTANAYLGGWGIAAALGTGADVVVCGRVADASLVSGAAAWRFGWSPGDLDRLAGAVVAGHVLECGTQATGGNYAFFRELPDPSAPPGFPIAEIDQDGSAVITKHPGTGGLVSVGTVTAQLLYEIGDPAYANPDVVARFDTVTVEPDGPDRVRLSGTRGEPAPELAKVAVNWLGGFRNTITLVLTGLDVEAKAAAAEAALLRRLGGRDRFAEVDVRLVGRPLPDADRQDQAVAELRVTVKDPDPAKVGRAFSNAVVELALSSYPGCYPTTPPGDASPYGVYSAVFVPAESVEQVVVNREGERVVVPPVAAPITGAAGRAPTPTPAQLPEPPPTGPTRRVPLGVAFGARSGDKGGDANVGVWARSPEGYAWLAANLDLERFRRLLPEAAALQVWRYELPNLLALNFVVEGLLGEGVSSSVRFDSQAKGLGEYLRSRIVELPVELIDRDAERS